MADSNNIRVARASLSESERARVHRVFLSRGEAAACALELELGADAVDAASRQLALFEVLESEPV